VIGSTISRAGVIFGPPYPPNISSQVRQNCRPCRLLAATVDRPYNPKSKFVQTEAAARQLARSFRAQSFLSSAGCCASMVTR
jgi:hypothetical protein